MAKSAEEMHANQTVNLTDCVTCFLTEVSSYVGCDVVLSPFETVLSGAGRLSGEKSTHLLDICMETSVQLYLVKHENVRVALARLLVALLPSSFGVICDLLSKRQSSIDYEIHFSLFCYLDWAPLVSYADILGRTKRYLLDVPKETAMAAWMAGHMLGGHWRTDQALEILMHTAVTAKYVAGRRSSVFGLEELGKRFETVPASRQEIAMRLWDISVRDRSSRVRVAAQLGADELTR